MDIKTVVNKLRMVGASILDYNSFCIIEVISNGVYRVFIKSNNKLVEYEYNNVRLRMNEYFVIIYTNKGNANAVFTRNGPVELPDSQHKVFRIWADKNVPYETYEYFRANTSTILILQTYMEFMLVNKDGKTLKSGVDKYIGGYIYLDYNKYGPGRHRLAQASLVDSHPYGMIITDDLEEIPIETGGN